MTATPDGYPLPDAERQVRDAAAAVAKSLDAARQTGGSVELPDAAAIEGRAQAPEIQTSTDDAILRAQASTTRISGPSPSATGS
jgi:hypothetical protein